MWSLPNIVQMNARTAAEETQSQLREQLAHPEAHQCEVCDWDGERKPAEVAYLTYTVYSDLPDGVIFMCEAHDGFSGSPMEGYFTCGECDRVFANNITWELHYVDRDEETLCLNCARRAYLAEPGNWVDLADAGAREAAADFENLRQAPHLYAVDQVERDTELQLIGNAEYDSMGGGQISGRSLEALLEEAREAGHERAVIILDGAYQFAVSIGVYVEPVGKD